MHTQSMLARDVKLTHALTKNSSSILIALPLNDKSGGDFNIADPVAGYHQKMLAAS